MTMSGAREEWKWLRPLSWAAALVAIAFGLLVVPSAQAPEQTPAPDPSDIAEGMRLFACNRRATGGTIVGRASAAILPG